MSSSERYDDVELLRAISMGDETSFNILFARYRNQLFSYLYKITKSPEGAEEIVLDVFLKIWVGRSIAGEIQNFEGFIFRVAHNKAIDFLRAVQRNPTHQADLYDLIQENAGTDHAESRLEQQEAEEAIHDAIHQLSPQRQKVFQLSREDGLSYDEIAGQLGLSRHTVRNHMAAALEFIREHLKDRGYHITCLVLFLETAEKMA